MEGRRGRKSKGDRVVRTTRLARAVDDEIRRLAAEADMPLSEYVASLAARHTGHPEHDSIPQHRSREELPLTG